MRSAALFTLACGLPALAQFPAPNYRLDFTLKESTSGLDRGARTFTMMVADKGRSRIDASQRIPYEESRSLITKVATRNVGVTIDCQVRETEGKIRVRCDIESSSLAAAQPETRANGLPPVVDSLRSTVDTVAPLGKPALVAVMEDPNTKKKLEVSLVARRDEQ